MPSIVDSLNIISKTMENILDFIATDKTLSEDFSQYLEINDVNVESDKEFNNEIIHYALDMKMQNGLRVLEYYRRNNKSYDEVIDALLNSFSSVFKVNKILSNGFNVHCLTSEVDLELIPMVKMNHLKQIGKNDFIKARILELDNIQYILEIYDVISEFNVFLASTSAITYMLQNPKTAHYKNEKKKEELEKSVEDFYDKFTECFGKEYVVTTNKYADDLIEFFNNFRTSGKKVGYDNLIKTPEVNKYFKVKEYECNQDVFIQNAIAGFSSHKETYDIGLWVDKKRGFYIIPFFETFLKCFKEDIEGKNECIKEFLTNDKIPPSILKYAFDNNDNFLEVINTVMETEFTTFEEVLFNTKTVFLDSGIYSPVTVLFNSKLFSDIIGIRDEYVNAKEPMKVKRNDLCPCGSGLKYKKCCGKNL